MFKLISLLSSGEKIVTFHIDPDLARRVAMRMQYRYGIVAWVEKEV